MNTIAVYCMPGMAANPIIFEYLELPKPFEIHYLSWIPPKKNEMLSKYAKRMSTRIIHQTPVLLGVSFGGILVQEMTKYIKTRNVVIVSSVKNKDELPFPMKIAKKTNAHKLLPTQWIKNLDNLALFNIGKGIIKRLELYERYLSERNPEYLKWAIDNVVNWNQKKFIDGIIHIQGASDNVFPVKNISEPFIKIKGGHAIIITRANWFNSELPKLLLKN